MGIISMFRLLGVHAISAQPDGDNGWLQFGHDQTTPEECAQDADPFGCHTILSGKSNIGSVTLGCIGEGLVIIDGKPVFVHKQGLLELYTVTYGLLCMRRIMVRLTTTSATVKNACLHSRGPGSPHIGWRLGFLRTMHCSVPSEGAQLEF